MAIIMRYILSSIYIPHLLSHHPDPVEIHGYEKQKLAILQTHTEHFDASQNRSFFIVD